MSIDNKENYPPITFFLLTNVLEKDMTRTMIRIRTITTIIIVLIIIIIIIIIIIMIIIIMIIIIMLIIITLNY